jgi:hypothetical protein
VETDQVGKRTAFGVHLLEGQWCFHSCRGGLRTEIVLVLQGTVEESR